jgi:2-dehydro-3-deoxygalactonokinase
MGLAKPFPPVVPAAPLAIKTGKPCQVAGFWTADDLALDLLDSQGFSLQTVRGPGLRHASGSLTQALFAILADWDHQHGSLPLTLSGLAECPEGWPKADPLLCPADIQKIAGRAIRFHVGDRLVALAPGLTCLSRMGSPDYLWGEETLLTGAATLYPDLLQGAKIVCVPGACTRWIVLRHGRVLHFTTSIGGDIYRALCADTLWGGGQDGAEIQPEVFARGMTEAAEYGAIDLLHLLHQARCRSLEGEFAPGDIPSFLLGLLMRRDIATAEILLKPEKRSSIVLIAEGMQAYLYARAFEAQGLRITAMERARTVTAGLWQIVQTAGPAHRSTVAIKPDAPDRELA